MGRAEHRVGWPICAGCRTGSSLRLLDLNVPRLLTQPAIRTLSSVARFLSPDGRDGARRPLAGGTGAGVEPTAQSIKRDATGAGIDLPGAEGAGIAVAAGVVFAIPPRAWVPISAR